MRHDFKDLATISSSDWMGLLSYLNTRPNQIFFPKGKHCHFVSNPNTPETFTEHTYHLPVSLLKRESRHWRGQTNFLFLSEILGEGEFGTVFAVDGMLVVTAEGSFYYKKCFLIAKKIVFDESDQSKIKGRLTLARKEEQLSRQIESLSVRDFIAFDADYHAIKLPATKGTTMLISKRVPGINFIDYIEWDMETSSPLFSMGLRLEIASHMLWAYIRNFYRSGIIHKDLKLENAIATLELSEVKVFEWIDVGISKEAGEDDSDVWAGALLFVSPEVKACKGTTVYSDIFGLGKCFIGLFRGELKDDSCADVLSTHHSDLQGLFDGITDSDDRELNRIRSLIIDMTCYNPSGRISLQRSFYQLEKICFDRRLSGVIDRKIRDKANLAFLLGQGLQAQFNDPIRDRNLRCMGSQMVFNWTHFIRAVQSDLEAFPDEPIIVEQFIKGFHSLFFEKCHNKQEIIKKLCELTIAYHEHYQRAQETQRILQKLLEYHEYRILRELHRVLQKTINKCAGATLFDDFEPLNNKLNDQLIKYRPILVHWTNMNRAVSSNNDTPAVHSSRAPYCNGSDPLSSSPRDVDRGRAVTLFFKTISDSGAKDRTPHASQMHLNSGDKASHVLG